MSREVLSFRRNHEVIMKARTRPDSGLRAGWAMLLVRASVYDPYVACMVFDGDTEWWQGSYCTTFETGFEEFQKRVKTYCLP